ncbi:hypothetical protein [Methylophilus sp.]|jgi:hypothetical protein|uniref:hypothetical protein n=1 Tax=Methylophilus sp. TaxID=29541 RepID=UPI0011D4BA25|nr:hypothetical protein [Methylophilus sp.]TXI45144.1 MAG: hypothetical protein E6Q52_06825 [Methylophilus sp.]
MKHSPQSLAKQFCLGVYVNVVDATLWRATFAYIVRHADDSVFQKSAIAALWAQYGGDLRAKIKDDALVLAVLKQALPGYGGDGWTLYRGESWFLFDHDQIGFCWTPSEDIATTYAKGLNAVDSGGVLLKCYAPAEAILAMQNNVFICDPSRLLRLTTLSLFPKL